MCAPCPTGCSCSLCGDPGGLGGLTPAEEAKWVELLNGPHKPCECGDRFCGEPVPKPEGATDV